VFFSLFNLSTGFQTAAVNSLSKRQAHLSREIHKPPWLSWKISLLDQGFRQIHTLCQLAIENGAHGIHCFADPAISQGAANGCPLPFRLHQARSGGTLKRRESVGWGTSSISTNSLTKQVFRKAGTGSKFVEGVRQGMPDPAWQHADFLFQW
jgi:hypothetical protein